MLKLNKSDIVLLALEEIAFWKKCITESSLEQLDQKILLMVVSFDFWLQNILIRAQMEYLQKIQSSCKSLNNSSEKLITIGLPYLFFFDFCSTTATQAYPLQHQYVIPMPFP